METIFIVLTILITVITINLKIGVHVNYDIYKNIGIVELKIYHITVFKSEVSLIAGYFNFIRKNKKVTQIKIDLNDRNFKLLEDVGKYFIEKIYLIKLQSDYLISGTNPACVSVLSGNIVVLNGVGHSLISAHQPDAIVNNNIHVGYFDDVVKFEINGTVLITMFDLVWAIIRALVKRSLYGK